MEWRQAAEWGSREKLVFGSWGLRLGDGGLRHPRPATPSLVVWLSSSELVGATLGSLVFVTFQFYSHLRAVQNLLEGERIGIKSKEMSINS